MDAMSAGRGAERRGGGVSATRSHRPRRLDPIGALVVLAAVLILALGCADGGGGGGDDPGPVASPLSSVEQSARFLAQATLGANHEAIERVDRLGFEVWLDEQMAIPPSHHLPELRRLRFAYGDFTNGDLTLRSPFFRQLAWWNRVMAAPDVLRQRVALALSEIFVVSDLVDALAISPETVASYYDVLLDHAFGDYEALLLEVSLHPAMGVYLSHLNNDRGDPDAGRFPDENYAREVMQLFSVGLFELEPDGRLRRDGNGDPIPTYDNDDITELAKVFTGLGLQGPGASFGGVFGDRTLPMVMYEDHHSPGPKRLLDDTVIPGGQPGMQDVEDAVARLAAHPNVGPFLGFRLIQRLVKSNPSPEYVARVAAVWEDDGTGRRGQLGAVVRAILLDDEARRDPGAEEAEGFLREPFLRWVSLLRTFDATSPSGEYLIQGAVLGFLLGQHPMSSPSVFNFFQPDFAPNGPIRDRGLVAPEFQITTDASVIAIANLATYFLFVTPAIPVDTDLLRSGVLAPEDVLFTLDLSDEIAVAGDIDALLNRLDLLLTHGTLSSATRTRIAETLADPLFANPELRVRAAIHFLLMSPDHSVVR